MTPLLQLQQDVYELVRSVAAQVSVAPRVAASAEELEARPMLVSAPGG